MKLGDLFPAQNVSGDIEIRGLTADSRAVQPGYLFAALPGLKQHGAEFVPMALENGAAAILTDRELSADVPVIQSDDPRLALAEASARFYPEQPRAIAAITGTNGKSSSVDFLRQIWTHAGETAASLGTLGAVGPMGTLDLGHTTPDPVAIHQALQTLSKNGVSHLAMEASSHGLVQARLDGVRLSAVGFTNLTQDHLDYHPDFDAYRAAKLRLFTELAKPGTTAVINADSPESPVFEGAARDAGLKLMSVGWRGLDLKLQELSPRQTSQDLKLKYDGRDVLVSLPLVGEFQALNALMAGALAIGLGTDPDAVFSGMEALKPVKGRLEFVGHSESGGAVFVDYAHTPDGLDTLLRAARPHTAGKLVLVFGCGGDRDPYKRPMMGSVADKLADTVIVTDDNPRSEAPEVIRAAILGACPKATEIADRRDAIRAGISQLSAGDTLLIAGKGHETGQIVGTTVLPFSDQQTALDILGAAA